MFLILWWWSITYARINFETIEVGDFGGHISLNVFISPETSLLFWKHELLEIFHCRGTKNMKYHDICQVYDIH
jgi:hypothetical protein